MPHRKEFYLRFILLSLVARFFPVRESHTFLLWNSEGCLEKGGLCGQVNLSYTELNKLNNRLTTS